MKKLRHFVLLFLLTPILLVCSEKPLMTERKSGIIIPHRDDYKRLSNGILFVNDAFWDAGYLMNRYFRMMPVMHFWEVETVEECLATIVKNDSFNSFSQWIVPSSDWKLISMRYSDLDEVWYLQFRLKSDDESLKSSRRLGFVLKKVGNGFLIIDFQANESQYLSGERAMLRFLESTLMPSSGFRTVFKPLFPFLSQSFNDLPRSNPLWNIFEKDESCGVESIFYSLSDEDSTVYLLGSIHSGTPEFYPLPAAVENAFESCSKLVFEAVPENNTLWEIRNYSRTLEKYSTGENLMDFISAETFESIKQLITTKIFTIPDNQLIYQKPWVLYTFTSSMIQLDSGIQAEYGIENYFVRQKRFDMKLEGLEDVKYHLSVLDRISPDYWISELLSLEESAAMDELELMLERWRKADLSYFDLTIERDRTEKDPSYYHFMLEERNRVMVDSILNYLAEDEDCFIIAGTAHFAGEHSIPSLLEAKGVEVFPQFPILNF